MRLELNLVSQFECFTVCYGFYIDVILSFY